LIFCSTKQRWLSRWFQQMRPSKLVNHHVSNGFKAHIKKARSQSGEDADGKPQAHPSRNRAQLEMPGQSSNVGDAEEVATAALGTLRYGDAWGWLGALRYGGAWGRLGAARAISHGMQPQPFAKAR
jgi:hypothetical protein